MVEKVDIKTIKDSIEKEQIGNKKASDEEKAIIINAHRFFMLLPYENKWEIETKQAKLENEKLNLKIKQLCEEMKMIQEKINTVMQEKQETQRSLDKAQSELDYAWNKLVNIHI